MRYLNKIILSVLLLAALPGCQKYLDVVPDNIPTLDDAFIDRASALRALAGCYSQLPKTGTTNEPGFSLVGDDKWIHQFIDVGSKWRQIYRELAVNGNNVTRPLFSYWHNIEGGTGLWQAIRDCNTFIANVSKARDLDKYEMRQWIAEVKTLKAWYHFYLLRMYGPIPIVKKNLPVNASEEEIAVYRQPVDSVVSYIVQLLDEAIPDLPLNVENMVSGAGRIARPAAAAIKARVLVTAASPLFNGNKDYINFKDKRGIALFNAEVDQHKWVIAAQAAKEAIDIADEAGIKLYHFESTENISDSTRLIVQVGQTVADKYNEGRIWSLSTFDSRTLELATLPRLDKDMEDIVYQWYVPTLKMAEMFYSSNGVPIDEDIDYDYADRYELTYVPEEEQYDMQPGYTTIKLHLNREPRFYGSLGVDGGWWYGIDRFNDRDQWPLNFKMGSVIGGKIGNQRYSPTCYYIKKLSSYLSSSPGKSQFVPKRFDFPLFRLADLYLLYAEALNESLPEPSQEVYHYIDLVRERSGLKGVVESWANFSKYPQKPTTTEGMREIIHRERNIELAFEGQRFWDIRRWKEDIEVFNQPVQGWNPDGTTPQELYQIVTYDRKPYTSRDRFWPIMEDEILRNSNLIQNPGW